MNTTKTTAFPRPWLAHFVSADPDNPGEAIQPVYASTIEEAVKVAHRIIAMAAADDTNGIPPLVLDGIMAIPMPTLADLPDDEDDEDQPVPPTPKRKAPRKPQPVPAAAVHTGMYL